MLPGNKRLALGDGERIEECHRVVVFGTDALVSQGAEEAAIQLLRIRLSVAAVALLATPEPPPVLQRAVNKQGTNKRAGRLRDRLLLLTQFVDRVSSGF